MTTATFESKRIAALDNARKITLKEWLAQNDFASADEALAAYSEIDGLYPALCSEDCQVEPDGHCPHGAPSLFLALGVI